MKTNLRSYDVDRALDLRRFYELLDELEKSIEGGRRLNECSGRMQWPRRGVYFFMERGETRLHSGSGPRVVRVGTHALKAGAKTTLWTRLSQHKGVARLRAGNHRGSIFRLLVGASLIARDGLEFPTWGCGSTATSEVRKAEMPLELKVSETIGRMSVLFLDIEDAAGPASARGEIERNCISLLSVQTGHMVNSTFGDIGNSFAYLENPVVTSCSAFFHRLQVDPTKQIVTEMNRID
ncbi:hypothetical protein, partial [Elongatibacter sediminis]